MEKKFDTLRTEFDKKIRGLNNSLKCRMDYTLTDHVEKMNNTFLGNRDQGNNENNRALNIVIKNLEEIKQEKGENGDEFTKQRVTSLVRDSLRLRNVHITRSQRKPVRSGSKFPGIVIARVDTLDNKLSIMKTKRSLKDCKTYNNIYIYIQ